ncbi:hypothetical protein AAAW47_001258 [Cronobacter sakazakii]
MNYEITQELAKSGHQLAVLLGTQHGQLDAASLVQRMAGQLEVLAAVLREKTKRSDALAADNAALKAGPQGFFAYGSECGYEEFETAEKAMEFAEAEIADYRDQACDGWSDEVGSVVWGIVMQRASMTGLRPVKEDDNAPSHIEEFCDYALLPNIETPATDAFLREVKAQGAESAAAHIKQHIQHIPDDLRVTYHDAIELCSGAAAELRKGGAA